MKSLVFRTWYLSIALFFAVLMVGCGGGGGDSSNESSSGGGDNLVIAYDKIKKGMSFPQVVSVVGTQPTRRSEVNGEVFIAQWVSGDELLTVGFDVFDDTGAANKSYANKEVSKFDML